MSKPTHVLTARSRSGKSLNALTGGSSCTISVYGQADLDARLTAWRGLEDPDLEVTIRELAEDER